MSAAGASSDCALVVVPCGDFSWQAQGRPRVLVLQSQAPGIGAVALGSAVFVAGAVYFGHGRDRRGAQHFVNLDVQIS